MPAEVHGAHPGLEATGAGDISVAGGGSCAKVRRYLPTVNGTAIDIYGAAFVARYGGDSDDGGAPVIEPGLYGVVPTQDDPAIRLLVTDDRAYGRLTTEVRGARRGIVNIVETASRCNAFMGGLRGWKTERPATAMVCRYINAVPDVTLPDGLALRPVNRSATATSDAVPLPDAVAVAMASDPGITDPADEFAAFLSSLSLSVRLFVAVDKDGIARATSGCDVFGEYARVFFVNTEPGWRRRGVGHSMTVAALRTAALSGALRAVLDATDSGASVYTRLGFEVAGRHIRYSRRVP